MPQAQLPDGTILEFPDGTPDSVIDNAVKAQLNITAPQEGRGTALSSIANAYEGAKNGFTLGAGDEIQAAIAAGTVGASNLLGGDSGLSMGEAYDQALELNREDQQQASEQSPLSYTAGQIAGGLIPAIYSGGTGGGQALANYARAGNAGARIAKGSALGAISSGIYGFNEGEGGLQQRAENAVPYAVGGAALGGAIPAVGAAIASAPALGNAVTSSVNNAISNVGSKIANRLLPELDETSALLAKRAEELNIPLYLDQVSESPALNNVQKISQELPFSGIPKREAAQSSAVMRAINSSFGSEDDKITPNVIKSAYRNLGKQFDDTFKGREVVVTPEFTSGLDQVVENAGQSVGKNVQDIIKNNVNYIKQNVSDGIISGEKINQVRSKLSENIRNAKGVDGQAAQAYLGDLLDKVIDTSFDGLDPAAKEAFGNLRFQYKNLITVTPLAAKATRGNINPQLLENRVSRVFGEKNYANGEAGVLGDIAKISKTFLPKKGGSDTIPKGIYAGSLAGVAAAANPALALAVAPNAAIGLGANRLYQNAIANPKLVNSYVNSSLAKLGRIAQDEIPLIEVTPR